MLYEKENRLIFRYDAEQLLIERWGENALRVRATKMTTMPTKDCSWKYCPDEHDEMQISKLIGLLHLFYRPQKVFKLGLEERRDAALRIIKQLIGHFPEGDVMRSKIFVALMEFNYDQSVLQWTLQNIKGTIQDGGGSSGIHEGLWRKLPIRDPMSMKLIIQKTENLHRFYRKPSSTLPSGTPTSLAMYQPGMFFTWRNMLLELGYDLEEFVRRELEESHLANEGWECETLALVFKSKAFPDSSPNRNGYLQCERCGLNEEMLQTMVDLPWRRHLRSRRSRRSKELGLSLCDNESATEIRTISITFTGSNITKESVHSTLDKTLLPTGEPADGGTSFDIKPALGSSWPYKIVCSMDCVDGICVARVYDDESTEEPHLPPYHARKTIPSIARLYELDDSPSKKMPGAFRD